MGHDPLDLDHVLHAVAMAGAVMACVGALVAFATQPRSLAPAPLVVEIQDPLPDRATFLRSVAAAFH